MQRVDPFIRFYPDLIDPYLCKTIIERFDADPRRHSGKVGGGDVSRKRSIDLAIRTFPDWEYLCRALDPAVSASFARYKEDVPNFCDTHPNPLKETAYQIQSYQPNERDGFEWHADIADRASSERVLAMIAYLNDVAEGGETEFRQQNLKIKPQRGAILWFPASFVYVHRGCVPKSGPKYIISCFLVYR
jgi:hypothetical protein